MDATSSSRSSPTPSDRRAVARVLGAKGLKGGLRVEILTDWPERLEPGAEVWPEGETSPRRIRHVESGGRVPVVHLDGIDSREAADQLRGRYLEVPARRLDEGAYYWDDLIGLRVESPAGTHVGELVEVFRAGGNEVYRVVGPGGERLVPALRSVVQRIDLESGVMVVAADDAEEVR
jgi:16S rRNA processing protein RimM